MENKSDGDFIIMKAAIETNKQEVRSNKKDSDLKMMKFKE